MTIFSHKEYYYTGTWFTITVLIAALTGCISLAEEKREHRGQLYVKAHFISAQPKLEWQSPKSLTKSAVRNYLMAVANPNLRPIGHSMVEINCPSVSNKRELFAVTGGSNRGDLDRFFFDGLGAGILLNDISGKLQRTDELEAILVRQSRSKSIRSIKVLLSNDACFMVSEYLNKFMELEVYQNFRADRNPLFGYGSGCASFALSILEVIGVKFNEQVFARSLRIPVTLFSTVNRQVTPLHLMTSEDAARWADKSEDHVHLVMPDPSVISDWIQRILEVKPPVLNGFSIRYFDTEFEVDARQLQVPEKARFPIFSQ